MVQTKDELARAALNLAQSRLHQAMEKLNTLEQHKGGYTANYKSALLTEYRDNIKEAQQLLHYTIENISNLTQMTTSPSNARLKELGIVVEE